MSFITKKILLAILVCSLPSLGGAAESAHPAQGIKTPAPLQSVPLTPPQSAAPSLIQAVPPTETTTVQKTPEASKTQQALRLGYADIERIGKESELGKASAAKAKEKQEKFQTQIMGKRKQLDKQKAAIEAKLATLTPQQREAKGKEFQKKVEDFQKFGMNAEKELQTLQEKLSKTLFETIEQAAADYGKANGLALVVVKRELLYLGSGVDAQDVTEGIIKLMNEKGQKK